MNIEIPLKLLYPIGHSFALPTLAIIADASSALASGWSPLINIGAIGCVLAWFLIRAEPRMGRIERAIDRSNRGNLVLTLALGDIAERRELSEVAKKQAQGLIQEIDTAADERGDR